MPNIQEVFNRLQETKKEMKGLKSSYRQALEQTRSYKETVEELKSLREKKKKVEENVRQEFSSEFSRLDNLKADIESDKMLLSDLAINKLVKGEKVELKDAQENEYEPIFNVSFKKRG